MSQETRGIKFDTRALDSAGVVEVMKQINDLRVNADVDPDHFIIDKGTEGKIFVPKWSTIDFRVEESRAIRRMPIEEHIQQILDSLDREAT